jgi:hypothetical protein
VLITTVIAISTTMLLSQSCCLKYVLNRHVGSTASKSEGHIVHYLIFAHTTSFAALPALLSPSVNPPPCQFLETTALSTALSIALSTTLSIALRAPCQPAFLTTFDPSCQSTIRPSTAQSVLPTHGLTHCEPTPLPTFLPIYCPANF